MHLRGTLSETSGSAGRYAGHSSGHVRTPIIDRAGGSVHQEVVIAELEPGGRVETHLHAFEEAFYVLEGELVFEAAGATEKLGANDYAFVDRGVGHSLRNDSGATVRWLEASAPQPGATVEDTVFAEGHALPDGLEVPYWRDHFDAAELPQPSGAILEGFDAANVGGAALKILVGPPPARASSISWSCSTCPAAYQSARPRVRGGFLFLEGEIEANLGGEISTLRAGDYCWSAVGDMHALKNPVRRSRALARDTGPDARATRRGSPRSGDAFSPK